METERDPMGEKSKQKRQYILDTSRQVFAVKGFKNVTMKDIVDACGISRGGLYLYFHDTDEIFSEILTLDAEESDDVFTRQLTKDASASDILALFLKEQKKELLRRRNNISMAVYEFFLGNRVPRKENLLYRQFEGGARAVSKLIEIGNENGEFDCSDPIATSYNIMFVLSGMRINSQTVGLSESAVDSQILFLLKGISAQE